MTSKQYAISITTVCILVVILWFINPFEKKAPIGAPTDFYEIADSITESNVPIYYFGDNIPFPDEVRYNSIKSINEIPNTSVSYYSVIVLDFNEVVTLSPYEKNILSNLYTESGYNIVILNNSVIGLEEYIESDDIDNNFIFLDFTSDKDVFFSTSVEIPDNNTEINFQYILMHQIEKRIPE